jgi:hypothetical protein
MLSGWNGPNDILEAKALKNVHAILNCNLSDGIAE